MTRPSVPSTTNKSPGKSSPAERRIEEFIANQPDDFIELPMRQIAAAASVSEITLIRFCRRRGFDGVPDFRIALAKELAISRTFLRDPIELQDPLSQHLEELTGAATDALRSVSSSMPTSDIAKAAALLLAARQIEVVGMAGASGNVAAEAVNRLFRLGLPVRHTQDSYQQRMMAATLHRKDVALVISASGELRLMLETVRVAQDAGALVVAVTRPNSTLAQVADVGLTYDVLEMKNVIAPSVQRYAQLHIVDMIALAVAHAIGPPVVQRLQRVKETMGSVIRDSRGTPIGD